MPIHLRIDVEKPYGNHTLPRKIVSKVIEAYFPFAPRLKGYLSHLKEFIQICNEAGVKAMFFHRLCNVPDQEVLDLYTKGGHQLCFHFENSRSFDTLRDEIILFNKKVEVNVKLISKHGSGYYKLGKHHYPKYEPQKYREWADHLGVKFLFGNGIPEKLDDLKSINGYFENVFWMEGEYRHKNLFSLDEILRYANEKDVVILGHPESFFNIKQVEKDFRELFFQVANKKIGWKTL